MSGATSRGPELALCAELSAGPGGLGSPKPGASPGAEYPGKQPDTGGVLENKPHIRGDGRHHEIPTTFHRRDIAHSHRERLRRGLIHLDSECRGPGGGVHNLLDVHDLVHVDDRHDGGQAGASAQACGAQGAGRPPHDRDGDDSHHRPAAPSAAGDDSYDGHNDPHDSASTAARDDHAHDSASASADHHPAHDDHEAFGIRLHSAGRRWRR
jgi:hypothetical protein